MQAQRVEPLRGAMRAVAEADKLRLKQEAEEKIDLTLVERYAHDNPNDPIVRKFNHMVEEVVQTKAHLRAAIKNLRAIEYTMVLLGDRMYG